MSLCVLFESLVITPCGVPAVFDMLVSPCRSVFDTFVFCLRFVFFFKQKTAYEMRISDWSSDVCSSDLFDDPAEAYGPADSRINMAMVAATALFVSPLGYLAIPLLSAATANAARALF